jgi:hypothetical protein
MNVDENLTTTDFNEENYSATEPTVPQPIPSHLYAVRDGDKYGYVAAVSEEDQKQGKVAGDVMFFVYRGRQGDIFKLDEVTPDGMIIEDDECSRPCSAIKRYTYSGVQYMGFEPTSLAGAAFTDAFNGFLRPAPLPHVPAPASQPYYSTPPVAAAPSSSSPNVPDNATSQFPADVGNQEQ